MTILLDFVLNMIQNFLHKSIYIYKMASRFHLKFILQKPLITVYCTVPENIHTPPTQGIGIYWGVGGGGFCKAQEFKEMYEAYFEFPEGWGGS